MERTISGMIGKGSVNHNTRAFSAKNVDRRRSSRNVTFCHEDIKSAYHKLFDAALERYNARQKRSDRRIEDYYEKIRRGKQEKLFHEVIFQIGNKDDMSARGENGELAKEILMEFMKDFQERNPNLHVFSAHLHMDEETPHVHIDFIPFIRDSKRGLDTRVTLKGALSEQGFPGGTRGETEWNQWIESEKEALACVMERHGIGWLKKGTHNRHLSVLDYEKQERIKEVAELKGQIKLSEQSLEMANRMVDRQVALVDDLVEMGERAKEQNEKLRADHLELERAYHSAALDIDRLKAEAEMLQMENEDMEFQKEMLQSDNQKLEKEKKELKEEVESLIGSKEGIERDIHSFETGEEWNLPEPALMQNTKTYRDKVALPLVNKLKSLVKSLILRCTGLMEQVRKLTEQVECNLADIEWYKGKVKQLYDEKESLQEKAEDLERVKRYAGEDKVQEMIELVKEIERSERERERVWKEYEEIRKKRYKH